MSPTELPKAQLSTVAEAAATLTEAIYQSLTAIHEELLLLWSELGPAVHSIELNRLKVPVLEQLSARGTLFNGAGVVMAENVLSDRPRHLEWWRRDDDSAETRRLVLDLNPRSEYYYDYTSMDWFTVPHHRDEKWVYGPYLDYAGAGLYICTFSIPVRLGDGTFLGIAGADVPVAHIESRLWSQLQATHENTVLVNANGRVIAGNDPEYTTGSRVPADVHATHTTTVHNTPWSIVSRPRQP